MRDGVTTTSLWRQLARALVAYAGLLLCSSAQAQPTCAAPIPAPIPRDAANFTWTLPTQNADGSAIKTPITLTIYEGSVAPANARCKAVGATSASLSGLSVGQHTWVVTAKTTDGESGASNATSKTIPAAPPNPPTGFTVVADLTAYKQRDSIDGFTMVAIGTVAPGTACNPALSVNGLNVVPRSAVTLASKFDTLPIKAFARCM